MGRGGTLYVLVEADPSTGDSLRLKVAVRVATNSLMLANRLAGVKVTRGAELREERTGIQYM